MAELELPVELMTWNRALPQDIDKARKLIFLLYRELGITRFRYADTLSLHRPASMGDAIAGLRADIPPDVELEVHCGTGLGERAGNAPLEEVVMAWRHLYGGECGVKAYLLQALGETVAVASGRRLPEGKPILGTMIFSHESGIHVDGLAKNPETYQSFNPLELGREHRIVLGTHSGKSSLRHVLAGKGVEADVTTSEKLLRRVHRQARELKRNVKPEELLQWWEELRNEESCKAWKPEGNQSMQRTAY